MKEFLKGILHELILEYRKRSDAAEEEEKEEEQEEWAPTRLTVQPSILEVF